MAENFFRKLETRVQQEETLLCIGLDPHKEQLPEPTAESACAFCLKIIAETSEYAALFKPNSAYFEQFGVEGLIALQRVISSVPFGIPILLDCKRGDIDTTAQAYAASAYEVFNADAVTLSPYMGWDSVQPFVTGENAHKGAFVLCKTSNPSANDIQSVSTGDAGEFLYEKVVQLCTRWNSSMKETGGGGPCVGVVAGATDLGALQRIRALDPDIWILCPGVGAQGGEAAKVCPVGLRADGSGMLISVSRGISSKAAMGPGAMAAEARRLRDEINALRTAHVVRHSLEAAAECATSISQAVERMVATALDNTHKKALSDVTLLATAVPECLPESSAAAAAAAATAVPVAGAGAGSGDDGMLRDYQRDFLSSAIASNALQFGQFTLKSGRVSPYFFNAGSFHSGANIASLSRCYARAISEEGIEFDVLFGPAYKGIPLATAVALALYEQDAARDVQVAYNRKEAKDHGEGGQMVGAAVAGRRVLIVDDVITAGTAIREAVQLLRAAGAVVAGVVVCLDREERVSEDCPLSAVQQVEMEFAVPVVAVVRLQHLVHYLHAAAQQTETSATIAHAGLSVSKVQPLLVFARDVELYRQKYGVFGSKK